MLVLRRKLFEVNPSASWENICKSLFLSANQQKLISGFPTITLERLRKRGYEAMLELYEKIAPHFNEPLYTSAIRTVV